MYMTIDWALVPTITMLVSSACVLYTIITEKPLIVRDIESSIGMFTFLALLSFICIVIVSSHKCTSEIHIETVAEKRQIVQEKYEQLVNACKEPRDDKD